MNHQLWLNLIKHNVSPNLLYFLDCCRGKIRPTSIINADAERIIAHSRGFLDDNGVLTAKALVVLEEFETFLVKTKKKVTTEVLGDNFLDQIHTYRMLFPPGTLPTGAVARSTTQEIKDKFVWFFKKYPEFGWDIVLEATNYYMYKKNNPENKKYMMNASAFIQKTDTISKTIKSTLAEFCQMIVDDPDVIFREQL
jgi:hypothetical protein